MVGDCRDLRDSQGVTQIQRHTSLTSESYSLFINLKSLKLDSFLLLQNITDFPNSIRNMFIIESSRYNFMINYPNPTTDRQKVIAGIVSACHAGKDSNAKKLLKVIIPLLKSFSVREQEEIRKDVLSILQESCSIPTGGLL